jgi:hypothetical protein
MGFLAKLAEFLGIDLVSFAIKLGIKVTARNIEDK